jgi:hypothetical protein
MSEASPNMSGYQQHHGPDNNAAQYLRIEAEDGTSHHIELYDKGGSWSNSGDGSTSHISIWAANDLGKVSKIGVRVLVDGAGYEHLGHPHPL